MRCVQRFFLFASPAIFVFFSVTGCVTSRRSQYIDAPSGQVFLDSATLWGNATFISRWTGPISERDKIDYLLDRIAASHYSFIRNGELHDGRKARLWLLYKMNHWVRGVDTAEDFVKRVASFSQRTGQAYLVQFPDGQIYSLNSVLKNELFAFETHVTQIKTLHPVSLPKPGQVSLSPTTVASTAVATSTTS